MRNDTLRALTLIAEGTNLPPSPEKHAAARAQVQRHYEALNQLLPRVQARASSLSPRLVGQDISEEDADEVDRGCAEIGDLARQIGTAADKLRTATTKFRQSKE